MAETDKGGTTCLGVLVSFAVDCAETLGLGAAAWVSGSVALRAQTAGSAVGVAVQVSLLIGVLRSVRLPDETHPLGMDGSASIGHCSRCSASSSEAAPLGSTKQYAPRCTRWPFTLI